jgi:hypothetical protein
LYSIDIRGAKAQPPSSCDWHEAANPNRALKDAASLPNPVRSLHAIGMRRRRDFTSRPQRASILYSANYRGAQVRATEGSP